MPTDRSVDEVRFDVVSDDGVRIAVWRAGAGPPLVLAHGSFSDHTTLDPLLDALGGHFTTFAMDRRGFGASSDAARYSIDAEFADVASVVEAVGDRADGSPSLFGHSFGASCALGGAARVPGLHRLVLYEPSLGLTYPPGSIDRMEAALAGGDRDGALAEALASALEMSDDDIDALRSMPSWENRLAVAHTIPRECRAEEGWAYRPGQFATIAAPTLFLLGSDTTPELRVATEHAMAAVGDPTLQLLEGHGHMAHKTDPAMVARLVAAFCRP